MPPLAHRRVSGRAASHALERYCTSGARVEFGTYRCVPDRGLDAVVVVEGELVEVGQHLEYGRAQPVKHTPSVLGTPFSRGDVG